MKKSSFWALVCTASVLFCASAVAILHNFSTTDEPLTDEPVTECEHIWNDGEITTEATATENGVYTYTCTNCGETYTEEIPYTGSEGLAYALSSDGTSYSVSGIGTCDDTDIVIAGVYNGLYITSIDDKAFQDCAEITSVSIPESVTAIGSYAFDSCTALESVSISEGVTNIGEKAFEHCSLLKSINIPSTVVSIGDYVFRNCSSLESIDVDSGNAVYKSIDGNLYSNDGKTLIQYAIGNTATSFIVPDSVTIIKDYAFRGCTNIETVTISDNVTAIPGYAFESCTNLVSVTLPESVTAIGSYAFSKCYALEDLALTDSIVSIGSSAFRKCTSLSSIYLGNSLISIGSETFYEVTADIVWGDNTVKSDIGYKTFKKYAGTSLTIPDSVTSIGMYAFSECTFTSIIIPDSVTTISGFAFDYCSSLTSIVIPDSLTSIGKYAFNGCYALESITLPFVGGSAEATTPSSDTLFGYIFNNNLGSTVAVKQYYSDSGYYTYYIPESLTSVTITGGNILYGAFYGCTMLTSVTLGDGVTSIGYLAFQNCSNLANVTLSDKLTYVEALAFYNCTALSDVYYCGSANQWANISFVSLMSVPLYYCGGNLYLNGTLATDITLDSITSINNFSFCGCQSLKSVIISGSVTSIGNYVFWGCIALTSIIIPTNVTSIGINSFNGCLALESATFENTEGWYVTTTSGATSGTDLTSEDLADISTAATYLTSTYRTYYWYRTE